MAERIAKDDGAHGSIELQIRDSDGVMFGFEVEVSFAAWPVYVLRIWSANEEQKLEGAEIHFERMPCSKVVSCLPALLEGIYSGDVARCKGAVVNLADKIGCP